MIKGHSKKERGRYFIIKFIYKSVSAIKVFTDSSLLTSTTGLVFMLVMMVDAPLLVPLIAPSCSLHVTVNTSARLNLKSWK